MQANAKQRHTLCSDERDINTLSPARERMRGHGSGAGRTRLSSSMLPGSNHRASAPRLPSRHTNHGYTGLVSYRRANHVCHVTQLECIQHIPRAQWEARKETKYVHCITSAHQDGKLSKLLLLRPYPVSQATDQKVYNVQVDIQHFQTRYMEFWLPLNDTGTRRKHGIEPGFSQSLFLC